MGVREARAVIVSHVAGEDLHLAAEAAKGRRVDHAVAIAHGEGYAAFDGADDAETLTRAGQIALRFVDNHGVVTESYPANPNGSPQGVTGLCNDDGRVTILMPHPERVFLTAQNSWHPADWGPDGPWLRLFRNARRWVD